MGAVQLVKGGHVYVAQPPLFRVKNKTNTYYVQTEEEMRSQLLDQGLADAIFNPNDGINVWLRDLGIDNPPAWTTSTTVAFAAHASLTAPSPPWHHRRR